MNTSHSRISLLCGLLACSLACSDNNVSSNNTNNPAGDSTPDIKDETPDTMLDQGVPDEKKMKEQIRQHDQKKDAACEPLTQCPADTCGSIEDTCGGTVECEPCACENGQPTAASCDACGVIAAQCDGDTLSCLGQTLDSFVAIDAATCATALLYVDADASVEGDGTKNAPYQTLASALDDARADANGAIKAILLKGDSEYVGTSLEMVDGVSILGGYADDWSIDERLAPTILGQAPSDEDVFGLKADAINTPTLLRNVIIKTTPAGAGRHAYGLYVKSSSGLKLYSVVVEPGAGGRGTPGTSGAAGYPQTAAIQSADPGLAGKTGGVNASRPAAAGLGTVQMVECDATAYLGNRPIRVNGGRYIETSVASTPVANAGVNTQCPVANGASGGEGAFKSVSMACTSYSGNTLNFPPAPVGANIQSQRRTALQYGERGWRRWRHGLRQDWQTRGRRSI